MRKAVDFSFDDRVARRYDHQRAHPTEVSSQIGEVIANLVGEGGKLLEIGVGTGRIAKPVAVAGCRVFGFDLSSEMLAQIQAPSDNFHALRADMHQFPFPDNSFDAVLAVHVLHLSKNWQTVLAEAARVLKPGGLFIQGDDWIHPDSVIAQLRDTMRSEVLKLLPAMMPPGAGASRQEILEQHGGEPMRELVAAEWTTYMSPEERLQTIESRTDSESWVLTDELFEAVVPRLRHYAESTWQDLNTPQAIHRRFVLKVTPGSWNTSQLEG